MKLSKTIKSTLIGAFVPVLPYVLLIGFFVYFFSKYSDKIIGFFASFKTSEIGNNGVKSDNLVLTDDKLTIPQSNFYVGFKNSLNSLLGTNTGVLSSLIKNVSNEDLKVVYQYALSKDNYDMVQSLRNEWFLVEMPFYYNDLKEAINKKFKSSLGVIVF